jgi:hypothetical protein
MSSHAIEIYSDTANPLRFKASSRSRGAAEHQVDLGAWGGNGSCTCEHFEFRLLPILKQMAEQQGHDWAGSKSTRCSHVLAARRSFTDHMINYLKDKIPACIEQPDDLE